MPTNDVQGPLLKQADLGVMKEYGNEDSLVRLLIILSLFCILEMGEEFVRS